MTDRHLTHLTEDELLDVALGSLDAPHGDALVEHLARCEECHARYRELDEPVRGVLEAAPSVAPPAGFSGRVLAAVHPSPRRVADDGPVAPLPQRRWRTPLLAAAAGLVGAALGVGATLGLLGLRPPDAAPPTPAPPTPAATTEASGTLVTSNGQRVGTAALTRVGGDAFVVVSVSEGRPGGSYECFLVDASGRRTSGGSWTMGPAEAGAAASGVWLVPVTGDPPASVELQVGPGRIWASAGL